jgi:hypothetical protein
VLAAVEKRIPVVAVVWNYDELSPQDMSAACCIKGDLISFD